MNAASMLLGAALVVLGVLAGAMADRVRYGKTKRERAKTKPDEFWRGEAKTKAELPATHAHERMAADVVAALVQSGYRKAEAVTDPQEKIRLLTKLVNGFAPEQWDKLRPATAGEIKATAILSLKIEEASAKVRSGPPEDNDADYAHPVWAGVLPIRLSVGAPEPDPRNLPDVVAPEGLAAYSIG